jgi:polysaccharide pyruvyl transferase WcaK-like protein
VKSIEKQVDKLPYILLLGVSLDSDNRGVNALGLGAIELLHSSFGITEYILLKMSPNEAVTAKTIVVNDKQIDVRTYSYSKNRFLISLLEFYSFKLFRVKPTSELSLLVINSKKAFNVNEGDSFSDIYGLKRIVIHFLYSFVILLWGKELTFLPQTIGPFKTFVGVKLAKYILRRAKKVYVRDAKGKAFLNKLKIPYTSAMDMAVYMQPKKVDFSVSENTVGINVNGLLFYQSYGQIVGKFEYYKNLVLEIINVLIEEGFHIILVPHTYNISAASMEDDLSAIKEVLKENRSSKLSFVNQPYDARELKYVISQLVFFVGSRMHSCIAALSTSVPTIGLAYSPKFEGTFEIFGQKECVINISGIKNESIHNVVAKITEKVEQRDFIRKSLRVVNENRGRLIID